MATYTLHTPLQKSDLVKLKSGDKVLLNGIIYSARDAAHKRLCESLDKGEALPFDLQGAAIYYMGPAPAPEGHAIGSAGPTTSYRMDAFAPRLYSLGLGASIGKGRRAPAVREAMQSYTGVYLGATGGAGALISKCIIAAEVVAYPDLGAEAVRKLTVKDFPLLVINDAHGGELYVSPVLPA
ncbi:MAG: Fe-S-containing hydro-lyase [Desulfovibrionaceae bacterium]